MLVEILISTAGDKHELEDFYHWLRQDVGIVRAGTVTASAPATTGAMGAFETVSMILSNASGLASLAISYSSWLRARKNPSPLTFTPTSGTEAAQQAIINELNQPRPGQSDE